jgi:hypothetical protein
LREVLKVTADDCIALGMGGSLVKTERTFRDVFMIVSLSVVLVEDVRGDVGGDEVGWHLGWEELGGEHRCKGAVQGDAAQYYD